MGQNVGFLLLPVVTIILYSTAFAQDGAINSPDPGMKLIAFVALLLCVITIILIVYKLVSIRRDPVGITTRWIFLIVFITAE